MNEEEASFFDDAMDKGWANATFVPEALLCKWVFHFKKDVYAEFKRKFEYAKEKRKKRNVRKTKKIGG